MSLYQSPLQNDSLASRSARVRPVNWLRRLRLRCAAPGCQHRGRLWPPLLSQFRGVVLDGRWYCTAECFQDNLIALIRGLLAGSVRERPRRHRVPLGLLLINNGIISQQQLRDALQTQLVSGGEKLGQVLCQMGLVAREELTIALANQWGCPVYPLTPQTILLGCNDLLPWSLLHSARALPVFVSSDGRTLHLAFGERLDHTTLYAVEHMLGCRTIACIADELSVTKALEELRRGGISESSFDTMRDPREIAGTIRSYAGEYRATSIAVARASSYLWVRFANGVFTRDILFRIRPETESGRNLPFTPKVFSDSADTRREGVSEAAESL